MGKRNLVRIISWENLITFAAALTGGLLAGILLSKLAELGLMNLLSGTVNYAIRVDVDSIVLTAVCFAAIFLLITLSAVIRTARASAVNLMKSENVGEKPPKGNWLLALLGGGVLVQRFGDLIAGRRTNDHRLSQSFTVPTLKATPGDLSLVIPKRQLDDIIEMIYALDKIAPGTANYHTLLYGVEVNFYNSKVSFDDNLETDVKGLYVLGDGSGVTHSLSQASASGVYAARKIAELY